MSEERKKEVPSPSVSRDHHDDDKFLKVTPNLFTPERLHLFDSLDLYASLIKCSKNVEQGERLHNISWRIINKSLLKDRNINKSKKREGVKNLYYVLNPMTNKQPLAQQQQLEQRQHQHPGTHEQQVAERPPAKLHQHPGTHQQQPQRQPAKLQQHQHQQQHPQQQNVTQPVKQIPPVKQPVVRHPQKKIQSHTNLSTVQPPRSGSGGGGGKAQALSSKLKLTEASHNESSNTSLFTGAKQNKSTSALLPNHNNNNNNHQGQQNHINHHHNLHLHQLHKKEDPQTIVKGFDPNTLIRAHKAKDSNDDSKQQKKNTFYIGASPSPEPGAVTANSSHKTLLSRQESLFGNPKMTDSNNGLSTSNKSNLFFSSEDEDDEDDTDWDDDSLYDEEEDEHFDDEEEETYYRRQWDKLLFTKTQGRQSASASTSGNATPTSTSSHDPIKRSLLSGLFLNEQINNYSNSAQAHNISSDKLETKRESPLSLQPVNSSQTALSASIPKSTPKKNNIQRATLETSNVTAVGSVTPPQRSISNGGGLPVGFQRSAANSNRGSFSSIASESTRERYTGESNAPPAAQTILPTALSTHMFLPNNIHQQRLAAMASPRADAHSSIIHEFKKKQTRRESMDIPSKNKNKTSLKTRVEISEEEKFSRVYTRRNL